MAINWPIASSIGQIYTDINGTKWRWNGKAWTSIGSSAVFNNTSTISEIWASDKIVRQIESSTVNREKPIGDIDGVNKFFFLSFQPIKDTEHLYLNGILQDDDGDYIINGYEIEFTEAPSPDSKIRCSYISLKSKNNAYKKV